MPYETTPSPAAAAGEAGMGTDNIQQKPITRGAYDLNEGASAMGGMKMAQNKVRPGQGMAMGADEEATKEEQAEYERATEALQQVMYDDERASAAIAQQLRPEERVGSIAKASMLLIKQLDDRLDFDEVIIPQFTQDVVDRVIDFYENVHGEEISEGDAQKALGATWEGVMEMFGVDEDTYAEFTQGMGEEDFKAQEQQYKQFLGE